MTDYFNEEQLERLRNFQTPPQPIKPTRRKGTLRIANLLNTMHDHGIASVTTWDVESRLKALGLWDDLWPDVTDGAGKTLGDALGAHGLRLRSTKGKKGSPKLYLIPPTGIDTAHCEATRVELVDDPTEEAKS